MSSQEIAWVDDGATRFLARCDLPRPWADSALVRLIQGVWEREPSQARRILRKRISLASSSSPTEMCLGMVKVAAKRLDCIEARSPDSLLNEIEFEPMSAPPLPGWVEGFDASGVRSHAAYLRLALDLVTQMEGVPAPGERYLRDRRVAALLVSEEGLLLGAAINTNSLNRTRHAEINLIQGYCHRTGGPIPRGARLYITLKSCKMCAGMIWAAALDPASLEVIYVHDDPGPLARLTVLTPGSHERKRASQSAPRLLEAQIERQWHEPLTRD